MVYYAAASKLAMTATQNVASNELYVIIYARILFTADVTTASITDTLMTSRWKHASLQTDVTMNMQESITHRLQRRCSVRKQQISSHF
jgi:hypothetical protein